VDGRGRHLIEGTIDTVADTEFLLEGFEVDVGCLFLDSLVEDEIDVADNRSGIRLGLGSAFVEIIYTTIELGEEVSHCFSLAAVAFVDLCFNKVIGCDYDDNFPPEGEA
jgi:hypothetical protein